MLLKLILFSAPAASIEVAFVGEMMQFWRESLLTRE
jgi:hypothetical protein